jgi:quercetin dioxygenase-like cupin family protein
MSACHDCQQPPVGGPATAELSAGRRRQFGRSPIINRAMSLCATPLLRRRETMSVVDLKKAPEEAEAATKFSHVKEGDTHFHGTGLRGFFEYRDLGIADATNGKVIAHLVRAKNPPKDGTGWHRHIADFQIVLMTKGWARFMYEDKETFVQAGDCVHQRPGIVHYLFDYSPDMEYLEIVGPADFGTVDAPAPAGAVVPPVTPWK